MVLSKTVEEAFCVCVCVCVCVFVCCCWLAWEMFRWAHPLPRKLVVCVWQAGGRAGRRASKCYMASVPVAVPQKECSFSHH